MDWSAEAGAAGGTRFGEAATFYRSMAEDLTSLSKRTAELTWVPDVAPRSSRSSSAVGRGPAPTGRLPTHAREAASRPQKSSTRPLTSTSRPSSMGARRPSPALEPSASGPPSPPPAAAVEMSTRKPLHLQGIRSQPLVVTLERRGAQPRSQRQGHYDGQHVQHARARRLKLSQPRGIGGRLPRPAEPSLSRGKVDEVSSVDSSLADPPIIKTDSSLIHASYSKEHADAGVGVKSSQNLLELQPGSPGASSSRSLHQPRPVSPGASSTRNSRQPRMASFGASPSRNAPLRPSSPGAASVRSLASVRPSSPGGIGSVAGIVNLTDDIALIQDAGRVAKPDLAEHNAPVRARLASVMDLQLVLPEMVAAPPVVHTPSELYRVEVPPDTVSPSEVAAAETQPPPLEKAPLERPPLERPSPLVRPVIRGLIADVIDEMRTPENLPADVIGGVEIIQPFAAWRHRKPLPPAIDEDILGRRVGHPPPAYEESAPPPYEANQRQPTNLQQSQDALARAQLFLETQTQALLQAQTQAQTQLQMIAAGQSQMNAQREEALQLARVVQQHADDAQQRISAAAEQQAAVMQRGAQELQQQLADTVRQLVSRDTASAEQQLAFAVQQSVVAAQAALAAATPPAPPPAPAPPPPQTQQPRQPQFDVEVLPVVLDSLRRLEASFQQQLGQVMHAQGEERAAHVAAFRVLQQQQAAQQQHLQQQQQAPRVVQAIVPVPPPRPPSPPRREPVTTDAAAQVSIHEESVVMADGEAQACFGPSEEHEARVARFTDYLLNGPTGHREPPRGGLAPPLTPWPLPSDFLEVDAQLAEALGGPPHASVPVEDSLSDTLPFSSSGFEDMSRGEVSHAARSARTSRMSPGEFSPSEPSFGETFSDGLSLGEIPPGDTFDVSSDSLVVPDHSAGEVSGLSEVPSSGQLQSTSGSSTQRESPQELGEILLGSVSSPSVASEGEAAVEALIRRGVAGTDSSGELPPSFGAGAQPFSMSSKTESSSMISMHSPGSLASSGGPEPYLSLPGTQ